MAEPTETEAEKASAAVNGAAEAVLAEAGLEPVRVARCPDPSCPVCSGAGRAAA